MARLLLILFALAACVLVAIAIYAISTSLFTSAERALRPVTAQGRNADMAPTGIQKAAYVALIVVLFGVASGWLGGL